MTVKMMGVIYRAFKDGKLPEVTKEDINKAYMFVKKLGTLKEFDLRTYHRDSYEATLGLKEAVDAIFAGDYDKANDVVKGFNYYPAC